MGVYTIGNFLLLEYAHVHIGLRYPPKRRPQTPVSAVTNVVGDKLNRNPRYSDTSPNNSHLFILCTLLPAPLAPASLFIHFRSVSAHSGRPFPFPSPFLSSFSPILPTTCLSPWYGLLRSALTPGQRNTWGYSLR